MIGVYSGLDSNYNSPSAMIDFASICLDLLLNIIIYLLETLAEKVKKAMSSDLPFGRVFAVVHIGMDCYNIVY